ncbi:MAG: hypothetical protein KIH01_01125 [Candidatus Freyarchaeota archaeon]|nr:hypothetical protein [Candidatus Jordarchaeia archaeon]
MERVNYIGKEATEKLHTLLKNEGYPGSVDLLVVDLAGNMVAERLRYSELEDALESAFSLISACNSISKAFVQGDATECIVHGTKGYIVAVEAGQAILVAAGIPEHQLGLMLQKLRGTAKKIKNLLAPEKETTT